MTTTPQAQPPADTASPQSIPTTAPTLQTTSDSTSAHLTLRAARRVVIKVGSALLVDDQTGDIRREWLNAFADDLADLRANGQEVVIVTSGAVATGRRVLGMIGRPLKLDEKQAAAATGQIRLAQGWQEAMARHALNVAQVLVTAQDTESRQNHLNARATINTLLRLGVIPLINENDTVATDELKVGDNDRLAARVAQMISADTLLILSDVKGLYTANPQRDSSAQFIAQVAQITPEIEAMAGGVGSSGMSTGGMVTKLAAAKIAMGAGCAMAIALGRTQRPLRAMMQAQAGTPEAGTWFKPSITPVSARKKWIAGHVQLAGSLVVDDGAKQALKRGKSLLPAGVVKIEGKFERGDVVSIIDGEGHELARGLSAYNSIEAKLIMGHQSGEIDHILGPHGGRDVLVHRDDLVLSAHE